MVVQWIKNKETSGSATLTNNYLMTNAQFKDKFKSCYKAIIGIDEFKRIVLKPISLDEHESLKFKDVTKVNVNVQKSYLRFGNTKIIDEIKDIIGLEIPKEGIKGKTTWDDKESALVVEIRRDEK